VHVWTFGQKKMAHCLLLSMVVQKEKVREIVCMAMLTTDISTSFEMKKQTVGAFLDISLAYDNVFVDVLCCRRPKWCSS
jgi:hypothetical protein